MALPLILGAIGSLLGGIAGSGSKAKADQNQTALDQFKTELSARIAQANTGATRSASIRTAPGDRLKQATQGNLAQEWTNPSIAAFDPANPYAKRVSGGIGAVNPSSIMRDIGAANQTDALSRSQAGQNSTDIAPAMVMPNAPEMSSSSWLDKLIGYGGAAATAGGMMTPSDTASPAPMPSEDIYDQYLKFMASQRKGPGQ
jgi:hypothetical protein